MSRIWAWISCRYCGGTGYVPSTVTTTPRIGYACQICGGTGRVPKN